MCHCWLLFSLALFFFIINTVAKAMWTLLYPLRFFIKVFNFSETHQEALEKSQASLEVFASIPLALFMWLFPCRIPLPMFWDNFVLHATSIYLLYLSWRWWEQIFPRTLKTWMPSVLSNGCHWQIRTRRNTTVHSGPDVVLTLPTSTEASDKWYFIPFFTYWVPEVLCSNSGLQLGLKSIF